MKSKVEKDIQLIKKLIDSSPNEKKKFVKSLDVVPDRFTDDQYLVKVRFHQGMLSDEARDEFFDDIWKTVYDYTGIPIGFVNLNKTDIETVNESEDKSVKVLESFLSELDIEGICSFWVDPEEDIHGNIWVYIVLDLDWVKEIQTKPEFVAKRMRTGLKEEIKKWTNLDVQVGSTAKKCQS